MKQLLVKQLLVRHVIELFSFHFLIMLEQLTFKPFRVGTPEYAESIKLRDLTLRKPLGRSIKDDNLEPEKEYPKYQHVGAFLNNKLVGTLMLIKKDEETIWMKQFGVDPTIQKLGVGTKLINFAEDFVKKQGFKKIYMHARKYAYEFYIKNNYSIQGDEFSEVGIPHYEMIKYLD